MKTNVIEFDFLHKHELCEHVKITIEIPSMRHYVEREVYTDFFLHTLFGKNDPNKMSLQEVLHFFGNRCISPTNAGLSEYLQGIGLKAYDPIEICKINHGVRDTDHCWIRFSEQKDLTWTDVVRELRECEKEFEKLNPHIDWGKSWWGDD